MPVIAALVDIRTLLEPAFNDYFDTVINSPIYFWCECVCNLFTTCHNPHRLPAPDSSSHFKTFLFILHRRRCQPFCFGFNTLLRSSGWLRSPPEPHLVALPDSQWHRNESSNPAPALVVILRSLTNTFSLFISSVLILLYCFVACASRRLIISVPHSRSLSAPYLKMKHFACKWLKRMQVHVKCSSQKYSMFSKS